MQEGGIASEMQLVHKINAAKGVFIDIFPFEKRFSDPYLGFTVSGDGTTIKHLNYEAKHITLPVPFYFTGPQLNSPSKTTHMTCFFGISRAPNHTSEMQLAG
jgi:hypothetical protein